MEYKTQTTILKINNITKNSIKTSLYTHKKLGQAIGCLITSIWLLHVEAESKFNRSKDLLKRRYRGMEE